MRGAGGQAACCVGAVRLPPDVRGGRGAAADAQSLAGRWQGRGAGADEPLGAGAVWPDGGMGALAGAAAAEGRGRAAVRGVSVAGGVDAGGDGAAGLSGGVGGCPPGRGAGGARKFTYVITWYSLLTKPLG